MNFVNLFLSSEPTPYNKVLFKIGPLEIHWYAVLILSGALIALFITIREGKRIGVDKEFLEDLVLFGIPISVVGARIYDVIFEWRDIYSHDILGVFKVWQGGLAIHGALIAAVIWGYFLCKKRGVSFLKAVDLSAVGFLFAQAMGRWGNFMNQEVHGYILPGNLAQQRAALFHSGLPRFIVNQMYITGPTADNGIAGYYIPTFFYESVWDITGMILLLILRRTKYFYIGDLGLIYLMWYSFGRYFIEGMRTDRLHFFIGQTPIYVAQLIGVVLFVVAGLVLIYRHYTKWYPKYYYQILEENKNNINK